MDTFDDYSSRIRNNRGFLSVEAAGDIINLLALVESKELICTSDTQEIRRLKYDSERARELFIRLKIKNREDFNKLIASLHELKLENPVKILKKGGVAVEIKVFYSKNTNLKYLKALKEQLKNVDVYNGPNKEKVENVMTTLTDKDMQLLTSVRSEETTLKLWIWCRTAFSLRQMKSFSGTCELLRSLLNNLLRYLQKSPTIFPSKTIEPILIDIEPCQFERTVDDPWGEVEKNEATNLTKCSVCLDAFTDPRALNCLHTFCFECLKLISKKSYSENQIVCPICRLTMQLPPTGVGGLAVNFYMKSLCDIVHKPKKDNNDPIHNIQATLANFSFSRGSSFRCSKVKSKQLIPPDDNTDTSDISALEYTDGDERTEKKFRSNEIIPGTKSFNQPLFAQYNKFDEEKSSFVKTVVIGASLPSDNTDDSKTTTVQNQYLSLSRDNRHIEFEESHRLRNNKNYATEHVSRCISETVSKLQMNGFELPIQQVRHISHLRDNKAKADLLLDFLNKDIETKPRFEKFIKCLKELKLEKPALVLEMGEVAVKIVVSIKSNTPVCEGLLRSLKNINEYRSGKTTKVRETTAKLKDNDIQIIEAVGMEEGTLGLWVWCFSWWGLNRLRFLHRSEQLTSLVKRLFDCLQKSSEPTLSISLIIDEDQYPQINIMSADGAELPLDCGICRWRCVDRASLHCNHTFCVRCVESHYSGSKPGDTIRCPYPDCIEKFDFPDDGFRGFIVKFNADTSERNKTTDCST